ncbi:hypothetical protein [Catellatospora coxensis]|uniref:Uncharacterized protein n=1 Tax=Catellatospora coxensis TaxID=310354 RepID=A0A8J3L3E2_9ACTN|nr:hypothetical protein [Catellatospora coxensis]GIG11053.1 hypothetical protein Cco03nite_77530 [Catellatospora coxensis]
MPDMEHGYDGPSEYARARAQTTDEQLAEGIRVAFIAVWWWFDSWWLDERPTANQYSYKRAELIRESRDSLAARGVTASLRELMDASQPLLGEYWSSCSPAERGLTAAIDALRDASLIRVTSVRRAREEVARWDDQRVLRTFG